MTLDNDWKLNVVESLGLDPKEVVNLDISMRGDSPFLTVKAELMIRDTEKFYGVLTEYQYRVVGLKISE